MSEAEGSRCVEWRYFVAAGGFLRIVLWVGACGGVGAQRGALFISAHISFSLIKRLNAQRPLVLSVGIESTMKVFLFDCEFFG